MTLLLISHDLATVSRICVTVSVMDRGRVVEEAAVSRLLEAPEAPAARALVDAARAFGAGG